MCFYYLPVITKNNYAKTHRGFQKRFESVTDMFDQMPDRGLISPLKAAYNEALAHNRPMPTTTLPHRSIDKRGKVQGSNHQAPPTQQHLQVRRDHLYPAMTWRQ
jgi:hypothetical protein